MKCRQRQCEPAGCRRGQHPALWRHAQLQSSLREVNQVQVLCVMWARALSHAHLSSTTSPLEQFSCREKCHVYFQSCWEAKSHRASYLCRSPSINQPYKWWLICRKTCKTRHRVTVGCSVTCGVSWFMQLVSLLQITYFLITLTLMCFIPVLGMRRKRDL